MTYSPSTIPLFFATLTLVGGCMLTPKDVGEFELTNDRDPVSTPSEGGDEASGTNDSLLVGTTDAPPGTATGATTSEETGADSSTGADATTGEEALACPLVDTPFFGEAMIASGADVGKFAGFTRITGNLKILGYGEFSLAPLGCLKKVGGQIFIGENDLVSLHGLEGLEEVVGELEIGFNSGLVDLSGLENVTKVGHLNVYGIPSLVSLDGLDGLTVVTGHCGIDENLQLLDLSGLGALTEVGSLHISKNDSLGSLAGVEQLESVIGEARIQWNPSLPNCTAQAFIAGIAAVGGLGCAGDNKPDMCAGDCP